MFSLQRPTTPFGAPRHPLRSHPLGNAPPRRWYQLADEREAAKPDDPLARSPALALLEAALMIADDPLPARKLAQVAGVGDGRTARQLLQRLQALYDADGSAFQVEEIAGGFQLLTRREYHPWLVLLRRSNADLRLSAAARETLAIIAYRQPIMRADLEAIRGVQSSEVLRQLIEKNLIRICGRDNSLGRPVLYGTTRKFLQVYGLKSLRDLPDIGDVPPPRRPTPPEAVPEES